MSEERRRKGRRRRRSGVHTPRVRRLLIGGGLVVVLGLVGANVVVIRRQRAMRTRALHEEARVALATGDLDAAEAAARVSRDALPGDREALYVLALVLEARGRGDEARALLQPEVKRDRGWGAGRVLLAAIAQREEDYAGALEWLPDGSEGGRVPATAYRILAEVRAATGDAMGAAAAYELAAEFAPDDLATQLGRGDLALARYLDTNERDAQDVAADAYGAAERQCRRRLADSEGVDLGARLGLATALMGQARALKTRTVEEVEAELRTVIESAGEDPAPTLILAEFLRGVGELARARRVLDQAFRSGMDGPSVRLALALLMAQQGETADALAALQRGVVAHPESFELRLAIVDTHVMAGRYEDAQAALTELMASAAEDALTHEALGDLARARARRAEDSGAADAAGAFRGAARSAYAEAVRLRPHSMPLKKKMFGEQLEAAMSGAADLTSEDRTAADAYVDDVLRVNPADADALAWRARILLLADNPDAVVQLLEEAASGPTPTLDVLRLYGTACERSARDARSADAYLTVLQRLIGRTADARDNRAAAPRDWTNVIRATWRIGRFEQAVGLSQDAARAWPEDDDLQLVLAQAYLLHGETAAAIAGLETIVTATPAAVEPRLLLASVLEREGRGAEAEAVLDRGQGSPEGAVLIALAGVLGRSGRLAAMETALARALAVTDDPGRAQLRVGGVLLSLDPPRIDEAQTAFAKAAESPVHRAEALARLADLALLASAADSERLVAARAAIDRAAEAGVSGRRLDYLEGKLALLRGDTATAVTRLVSATTGARPPPAALYYLAKALRAHGDARAAQAPLDRAIALAPGDAIISAEVDALRVELGVGAMIAGKYGDALSLLAGADQSGRTPLLAAVAYAGNLELRIAVHSARTYVTSLPGDRVARHVLATLLLRSGTPEQIREAVTEFDALGRDDATDLRAWVGLGAARLASDDPAGAETAFRTAYALDTAAAAVVRGVLDSLTAQGDTAAAIAFADEAARDNDDDAEVHLLVGDLRFTAGDADAAAAAYLRAADLRRDAVLPVLGAAAALWLGGHDDRARSLLEERMSELADPGRARIALAEILFRSGDLAAAESALLEGPGRLPRNGQAQILRGEIFVQRNELAEALRSYDSGVEAGARSVATRLRFAELLTRADKGRRAMDQYQRVLRAEPANLVALNNLAHLMASERNDVVRALELARTARELAPESPEVADTLGWLLVQSGDPSAAIPLLRTAVAALDDDPRVHFHLGLAAARVGLGEDARNHLERALAIDPSFPGAAVARSELRRLR